MRVSVAGICTVLLLSCLFIPNAHATAISSGTWYEFAFGGAGSFSSDCSGLCAATVDPVAATVGAPPYTFTLASTGNFVVQDLFLPGDQFSIFDSGSLLGTTSTPGSGASCNNDIIACSLDSSLSSGSFALGSGTHSITIEVIQSYIGAGAGAFELTTSTAAPTPEPSSFILLGTGVLGAAGALRRRLS